MHLAFVSTMAGSPWGGSEELWTRAAALAAARGHAVTACAIDWRPVDPRVGGLADQGAALLLRPRREPLWTRFAGGDPAWLAALGSAGAGVVCLSQGAAYECVGRRATRPLARWLAGAGPGEAPAFVTVSHSNKPETTATPGERALCRRLFARAAHNCFVAARHVAMAGEFLGEPVPRVRIVRNPVNLAEATPLPAPPPPVRFGAVGRLENKVKGYDLLLNALGAGPWRDRAWSLDIAGDGPDRAALHGLITRAGLGARVRLLGQVTDIRAFWAERHALLMASRTEGAPIALAEAMLLGRPALVTDVGACTEWVAEGREGWVAAEPSTGAVADALERAWADQSRWNAMGEAAAAKAALLQGPDPVAAFVDMLERVVSEPGSSA